jgi:hypothetical protein
MARWKLMTAHYLNVPGETWEYTENDRVTGRPVRQKFVVPRFLDPKDESCWTKRWGFKDNEQGEIIVCKKDQGEADDIVFIGDPTPDMMPVDDEARAISAQFESKWAYNPETAPANYAQTAVDAIQTKFQLETKPVEIPGLAELVAAISGLVEMNKSSMRRSV